MAPRNDTERTLASVGGGPPLRAVGVEDNFFELGGDSILSIQVIARCRQAGLHVTTRDLFKFPTSRRSSRRRCDVRAVAARRRRSR